MQRRWIVIIISVIILILLGLHLYYRNVQSGEWIAEDRATKAALEQSSLKKVTGIQKSVWEDVYYIVNGLDEQDQNLVVWVNQEGTSVHTEQLKQGSTKEAIQEKVLSRSPGADIITIVPGIWEQQYVWQVFYKASKPNEKVHYYYDFYRFSDAGYLTTYTLPNR
ncbi:DUF5590 domain-containing protein [Paenibacillus sp. GCM10027629]|uniref:cell wall elongation regulator TseB-like domain-containing protein n=1 Tax=Paenibacillus sp. GCM10027629 TaxID=3273414 RepID=UPI00362738B1